MILVSSRKNISRKANCFNSFNISKCATVPVPRKQQSLLVQLANCGCQAAINNILAAAPRYAGCGKPAADAD